MSNWELNSYYMNIATIDLPLDYAGLFTYYSILKEELNVYDQGQYPNAKDESRQLFELV